VNPLAWLNPGRWLLYIVLAGAMWAGYAAWAAHQRELGREEIRADFARQAKAADAKREVITQVVERRVVERVKDVQIVTETITKEIPVYVYPTDPALPGRFRVLHDAAARGEVPDPAAIADAAPIPAEDLAATFVANYGTCRAHAARLTEWKTWAAEQQAAH
jgi:hypothetical protein